jgi:hypothetical protein
LVKVVPLVVRLPLTENTVLYKFTMSPVEKVSPPLTESVELYTFTWSGLAMVTCPASLRSELRPTLAPAPTFRVPAAPTVTGPPNVEMPAPMESEPFTISRFVEAFVVRLSTESLVFDV